MSKNLESLTAVGAMDGTELLYIVDTDGNSRKITAADLKTFINTDPSIVPSSEPFRGALVKRTGTQSISANTETSIAWQAAEYDTDSFWSAGAATRLTVPAGVTKVRLAANVSDNGTNKESYAYIFKNGAAFLGGPDHGSVGGGFNNRKNLHSAVVNVSTGDYFELRVYYTVAATVPAAYTNLWMSIEAVEL